MFCDPSFSFRVLLNIFNYPTIERSTGILFTRTRFSIISRFRVHFVAFETFRNGLSEVNGFLRSGVLVKL